MLKKLYRTKNVFLSKMYFIIANGNMELLH